MKRFLLLGLLACCLYSGLAAQAATKIPQLGPKARISLITQWPGDAVYFAFGHSAFRVQDEDLGIDELFNYGVFFFNGIEDTWFIARFVYGQLDYMLAHYPFKAEYDYDRRLQNRIWEEQVLNLRPDEANRLFAFLVENAKPENRVYRYDFILDNCSTRVPLAFAKVFGDRIKLPADAGEASGKSFHDLIDEFVAKRPAYEWAFYLILGRAADRTVGPGEENFLPFYLAKALDRAVIVHDGVEEALVVSKSRAIDPPKPSDHDSPWLNPAWVLWPLAALVVGWTVRAWLRGRRRAPTIARLPARLADGLLFLVVGLGGVVIWFTSLVAIHAATKENWNMVWLLPSHLLMAGLVVAGVRWRWLGWYWLLSGALTLLPLLAWPIWPQAQHPTTIPLLLIIACRSLDQAWQRGRCGIRGFRVL